MGFCLRHSVDRSGADEMFGLARFDRQGQHYRSMAPGSSASSKEVNLKGMASMAEISQWLPYLKGCEKRLV